MVKSVLSGLTQSISQTVTCASLISGYDLHTIAQQAIDLAVRVVERLAPESPATFFSLKSALPMIFCDPVA